MIRIMTLGLLLLTGVALTACGQKGPLYLPSEAPASAAESSASTVQSDLESEVKSRLDTSSKTIEDSNSAEAVQK